MTNLPSDQRDIIRSEINNITKSETIDHQIANYQQELIQLQKESAQIDSKIKEQKAKIYKAMQDKRTEDEVLTNKFLDIIRANEQITYYNQIIVKYGKVFVSVYKKDSTSHEIICSDGRMWTYPLANELFYFWGVTDDEQPMTAYATTRSSHKRYFSIGEDIIFEYLGSCVGETKEYNSLIQFETRYGHKMQFMKPNMYKIHINTKYIIWDINNKMLIIPENNECLLDSKVIRINLEYLSKYLYETTKDSKYIVNSKHGTPTPELARINFEDNNTIEIINQIIKGELLLPEYNGTTSWDKNGNLFVYRK